MYGMRNKLKNALVTVAFPVLMLVLMDILCVISQGRHVFVSVLDLQNYVRATCISACTALALSLNLSNGRFDLSLGAQRLAAAILGGNLAIRLGLGGIGVLLFSLVFGLVLGGVVGLIFIWFRTPAMVLGLGMALIYECLAFVGSNSQGLQLYAAPNVRNLSNMYLCIVVMLLVLAAFLVIVKYTQFGYHMRAIGGSQKIAHNSGINIFAHAVGCYTLAGGAISFAGVFDAAYSGSMDAALGMTSSSTVMTNCFPMYLGKYLARFSNEAVGIMVASMTIKLFQTGLSIMKFSLTEQRVFTLFLFLLFLVFRANETIFHDRRAKKARVALAREKRKTLAQAAAV
jgi:ribose/xylose/arabinose/galactoside ABC-type transport system permease subunit